MMRKAVVGILLVFLIGSVSASSFGSFSSRTSVETDSRSATFTISTLNLGNEPLNVRVEPYNVDEDLNIDVLTPAGTNPFALQPSEITSNPSDSKTWFILKNGEYAETQRIQVRAVFDSQRPDNEASFNVRVEASPSGAGQESADQNTTNPSQSVVQVRTYSYTVQTSASRTSTATADEANPDDSGSQAFSSFVQSFTSSFNSVIGSVRDSSSGNGGEPEIRIEDDSSSDQSTGNQNQDRSDNRDPNPENQSSPTGNFFAEVNPVTPVLLLAALGSVVYLFRVM